MVDATALMAPQPLRIDDFTFFRGETDHIEICGSARHLNNKGIPVGNFVEPVNFDRRQAILGSDGMQWEVWGTDPFALHARRPRSEAERVRFIDHHNAAVFSHRVSKDREAMLLEISFELSALAADLASDKPMPRAARRLLKRKLSVLTSVQMTLFLQKADMPAQRQRLASIGLVVPQLSYFN